MTNITEQVCFQCSSILLEIERTVEHAKNSQSVVTRIIYHCTNGQCQNRIDKHMADMAKQRSEREVHEVAKALLATEAKEKAKVEKALEQLVINT